MLKCLACPNPVKAMLKDGATAGANMAKDAKDTMKKVQANLNGNLTMTSSADMEDVAASRRNLGAHAVAAPEATRLWNHPAILSSLLMTASP